MEGQRGKEEVLAPPLELGGSPGFPQTDPCSPPTTRGQGQTLPWVTQAQLGPSQQVASRSSPGWEVWREEQGPLPRPGSGAWLEAPGPQEAPWPGT